MRKGSHLTEEHKARLRGKKTEEHKRKLSLAKMGNKYRLGCKNSAESNYKNSIAHKNKYKIDDWYKSKWDLRIKIDSDNDIEKHKYLHGTFYGKHHNSNSIESNRQWHLGKQISEETKRKMSESHRRNNIWKGRKHTEESKKKQSEVKMAEKNPVWKNGASFEPYPVGWRKKFKLKIRERDNNTCQLCYGNIDAMGFGWATHHIDYNKDNLDESNLILLCKKCHGKTNHNEREKWKEVFRIKILCMGLDKSKKVV
jgi:hypothetical protein